MLEELQLDKDKDKPPVGKTDLDRLFSVSGIGSLEHKGKIILILKSIKLLKTDLTRSDHSDSSLEEASR